MLSGTIRWRPDLREPSALIRLDPVTNCEQTGDNSTRVAIEATPTAEGTARMGPLIQDIAGIGYAEVRELESRDKDMESVFLL